jgi:hypothetical protein
MPAALKQSPTVPVHFSRRSVGLVNDRLGYSLMIPIISMAIQKKVKSFPSRFLALASAHDHAGL